MARLYKRNVSGRIIQLSGGSGGELWPVSFNKRQQTKKHFSRNIDGARMFPSSSYGKHCLQCQFLFQRCKLCLRYTAGDFSENPSMRAVAKIL